MVRDYTEYDEQAKDIKKAVAKEEIKEAPAPILHIVEQLPTKELRTLEKDGQVHNFITTAEAINELWNKVMVEKKEI